VSSVPPPPPAQVRLGVQEGLKSATAVFLGEVIAREPFVVVLRVEKLWKGSIDKTVRMEIGTRTPEGLVAIDTCDYDFVGRTHLVFAETTSDGGLKARKCRLTAPSSLAKDTVRILDDLVKSGPPK
jgi:hypothetical protein